MEASGGLTMVKHTFPTAGHEPVHDESIVGGCGRRGPPPNAKAMNTIRTFLCSCKSVVLGAVPPRHTHFAPNWANLQTTVSQDGTPPPGDPPIDLLWVPERADFPIVPKYKLVQRVTGSHPGDAPLTQPRRGLFVRPRRGGGSFVPTWESGRIKRPARACIFCHMEGATERAVDAASTAVEFGDTICSRGRCNSPMPLRK